MLKLVEPQIESQLQEIMHMLQLLQSSFRLLTQLPTKLHILLI
jgi:hypothetical protein